MTFKGNKSWSSLITNYLVLKQVSCVIYKIFLATSWSKHVLIMDKHCLLTSYSWCCLIEEPELLYCLFCILMLCIYFFLILIDYFDADRVRTNWVYLLSLGHHYAVKECFICHWRSWCIHEQGPVKMCRTMINSDLIGLVLALFVT